MAACGPKTVLVKHVFGGVGGACQRSLYFVHYSVLHCKDLWDRCYVTCFYAAADGVGWGGVGGGMSTFLVLRTLIIVCYAAEISGIVAALLVATLQRSLVLLLRDMRAAMTVKSQKRASNFSSFPNRQISTALW